MTAHKHAAIMLQYAQDALETETPWERWQFRVLDTEGWLDCAGGTGFSDLCEYRRKPKTLTYTVTIPEPLREAPERQQRYFMASPASWPYCNEFRWCGEAREHAWLKRGLCFATKEDAIAAAKAILPFKEEA